MKLKKFCFTFNSYGQALEIIKFCKTKKIKAILYIKYHLINGLGIDWLIEMRALLRNELGDNDIKLYVDVKNNYGLFINLIEKKINYVNVRANIKILKKLKQIANINKVLINPNISIVDLSKSKNFILTIKNKIKYK